MSLEYNYKETNKKDMYDILNYEVLQCFSKPHIVRIVPLDISVRINSIRMAGKNNYIRLETFRALVKKPMAKYDILGFIP